MEDEVDYDSKGVRFAIGYTTHDNHTFYPDKRLFRSEVEADKVILKQINEKLSLGDKLSLFKIKAIADPVDNLEEVMVWSLDPKNSPLERVYERLTDANYAMELCGVGNGFKVSAFSKEVVKRYESRA